MFLTVWLLFGCSDKPEDTAEVVSEPAEDTPAPVDDLSWVNPDDLPSGDNPCREPTRVLVERVFDGDTFVAQGDNGEERVRIIGVNTPETGSGDCYAQEAKTFLINQIFGRHVWLTFDGNCYDRKKRSVAFDRCNPR